MAEHELTRRTAQSLAAAPRPPGQQPSWSAWTPLWTRSSASWTGGLADDELPPVERLSDLGARIAAAAGLGTNMELVVERVKLGGNGPIMANALAALGARRDLRRAARRGRRSTPPSPRSRRGRASSAWASRATPTRWSSRTAS